MLSSSGVPGMVAGLLEVRVRVPDLRQTGSGVQLELIVGEAKSQFGVTITVE